MEVCNQKLNRPGKKVVQNLSMASDLEIRVSSLDARNSQKQLRLFFWQNLRRWCKKSLKCFGSCKGKNLWKLISS